MENKLESNVSEKKKELSLILMKREDGKSAIFLRWAGGVSISMNEKNGYNWNTMVMNNRDGQFEHKLHKK